VSGVRLGVDELRPADAAAVGRSPGLRAVELAGSDRIERSVALRDELIATRQPIYGVTTGFGDRNVEQISPQKATALQRNLVRYHLVGSGPAAPSDVVRATMLIRANCLGRGYSGVRREVIELLLDCLAHDILPVVPERGSVGASGDLVPLCYLANMLIGDGDVDHAGRRVTAAAALRACGLRPVALQPKEALGLINGTSFMAGFAVVAAADAGEIAVIAEACTALAVEVLLGNRDHHAEVIHAQKPHPGQRYTASAVRALLAGSTLCRDHRQVLADNRDLGAKEHRRLDHPIQDRYSLRCAPHVVGVLRDTLDWVDRWLEIEINSTNDNPVDLVRDAAALHLAALCQAADLRGADRLGAGTRAVYDVVRKHVGFVERDRRLDGEVAALSDALRAGVMSEALADA
jgi:histidine ammonia-lyase/phenylalanine ammonia-lyase